MSHIEPTLTREQAAIVEAAHKLRLGECLRVIAFAGAGKTSTLRAVAGAMGQRRGLYVAFNKAIAAEAKSRFPETMRCQTMHSVAWGAQGLKPDEIGPLNAHSVLAHFGNQGWSPAPVAGLRPISQARHVARLVTAFCQGAAQEPTQAEIEELLDRHVLRLPPAGASAVHEAHQPLLRKREVLGHVLRDRGREACRRFLGWRANGLKISHDIYLKSFALDEDLIRHALQQVDYICLDEAQDLNPVLRQIAVAAGKPVIAVGDPWQAIYGWRGAQDALRHLLGDRLYLSQSFRFGDAVAAVARRVLASRPGSKPERPLRKVEREGLVRPYAGPPQGVRAVLCRTNARLLKQAFALAQIGRSFHVPGGIEEMATEVCSAQALAEGRMQEVRAEKPRRFTSWEQFIEEAEETGDAALARLRDAVEEGVVMPCRRSRPRRRQPRPRRRWR
ncbi:UvrD-helicase domain-containing protein [Sabulicella glaciei]|uniref:UvrD-helicase domain-containing protein n=1 Tax=Sabulicella glaciei TaxID=2984948 RepID=A0ABT3P1E2_9PROT|nr:UvrD-helicase domain-containing protein [Roseococcus sp. MDT2-1-1]MCW8088226.1 UvrD-helicase domain-containing protein [Roseococcus sp. MDT2-1-1]